MPSSRDIFRRIAESQTQDRLAVFDLDSTLFSVTGRNEAILRDLSQDLDFQKEFPDACELLSQIEMLEDDWGIREALKRLGLNQPDLFRRAKDYWNQHFFSNTYLGFDRPYEGALEFVKGIEASGAHIYYLTGRDEPNMRQGTIEILQKWGFPTKEHESRLHMKPFKGYLPDEDYKSQRFHEIVAGHEEVWFFENEPVIVERVLKDHPHINVVYIDTVHSGRRQAPDGLPVIDWRRE